jgi:hypothetical protein
VQCPLVQSYQFSANYAGNIFAFFDCKRLLVKLPISCPLKFRLKGLIEAKLKANKSEASRQFISYFDFGDEASPCA